MKKIIGSLVILSVITILLADSVELVYEDQNIKELRGVYAFDFTNGTVWVVGTDGAVRKSTDNGDNWQTVNISGANDYHLNSIFFTDANNGWIVGEKKADPDRFKGIIYQTTNGGASWSKLDTNKYHPKKYQPFKGIVFVIHSYPTNRDTGYIAAGEGYIYETTDGGSHWSRRLVDTTKKHCFFRVWVDPYNDTVRTAGDAGQSNGIIATKPPGGNWYVEFPYSGLGLNFFDVSSNGSTMGIACSKGYIIYKDQSHSSYTAAHYLPDQQVLYALNLHCVNISPVYYEIGGSDGTIRKTSDLSSNAGLAKYNLCNQVIKGVATSPEVGYPVTYFVGSGGRVYRLSHDANDWKPYMSVYGEYRRVRIELSGSESTYGTIYRSTCPDGPFYYVMDFSYPGNNQPVTLYDYSVDWSGIPYYYTGNGVILCKDTAWVSGLPSAPSPPPTPSNFTVQDKPSDNGGGVHLTWDGAGSSYTLYKDDKYFAAGNMHEYNHDRCVTGYSHNFKVRERQYYANESDYRYSAPASANCVAVNNLVPSAPSNLTGEKSGQNDVKLRWDEPDDIDIYGYNIYRKKGNEAYTKVNSVPCPRAFWFDTPAAYTKLWYKVTAVDWSGNESNYSNEIYFNFTYSPYAQASCDVDEPASVQIIPNPATGRICFNFTLRAEDYMRVDLYDVTGRMIRRLINDKFTAGNHCVKIDLSSENRIGNGVYFVRIRAHDYQSMEKLVIGR